MTTQPPEEPMCCTSCLEPVTREYSQLPWEWTYNYTHEDGSELCKGATPILESDLSLTELEPFEQDPDEWLDHYRSQTS
jgi:hypothetical protein